MSDLTPDDILAQESKVSVKKRKRPGAQGVRSRRFETDKSSRITHGWTAEGANRQLLQANPDRFFHD